ncbi:MAG TPA: type II secretion system secretin GspD [Rhizomicrobium sp.]|jgi:general secretion pathway protein D|nr:type II secretion system secretin GspD [Rhizomicrobium sp.]
MAFFTTDVHSRRIRTWLWPVFALALCGIPAAAQPPGPTPPGQAAPGNVPGARSGQGQTDDDDSEQAGPAKKLFQNGMAGRGQFGNREGPGGRFRRGPAGGSGPSSPPPPQDQSAGMQESPSGGITLNFVNADVRDVAKAVLGDYLQLNYEIASNTSGVVTIQTSKALAKTQVLPALEQALGLAGLALVHSNGIYEIMPLADARKQAGTGAPAKVANTLGYGMEVVHVKYVGAQALAKLLEPIANSEGTIRVDATRNALIIEGTAQQRETLLEDIALFDTDWLAGMHFQLFEPKYMDADELSKELSDLVGGQDSPVANVVRFVPLDRLNAVLVISPQEKYIDQMGNWVARLDRPGEGNDKKIYVYRVQNGRASDIANTLVQTLFGSTSTQQTTQQSEGNNTQRTATSSSTTGSNGTNSTNGSSTSGSSFGGGSSFGASGLGSSSSGTGTTTGSTSTGTNSTTGGTSSTSVANRANNPATPFQPVTTPLNQGGNGYGRYETVGGVSRENFGTVNITADETNNALVILATPREYAVIQDALRSLDVAPLQVLLEAAIAEVTLDNTTQFGFQYFYKPNSTPNSTSSMTLTNGTTFPVPPTTPLAAALPGFSYMFSNGNSLQAVLSAIANVTHVDVLSAPEVLVLNNQTAKLDVGDQVPIVTATATSTIDTNAPEVNSVQYLSTGVILQVTPRVNKGGMVMMDIDQQVAEPLVTTTSSINSPTIQQREIASSVSVADGETIALGGLFSNQVTKGKNGIPFLQDIPYLGHLFTNTNDSIHRDELMVLITPHVVDDMKKARAVTDELRHKLPEVQPIFEQKG